MDKPVPEFGLLGSLRVVTDVGIVTLPAKERVLLAALLLRSRQVVSVETLIDVLWDTVPPPSARNTVQGYVKRLRRRLGNSAKRVVTTGRGYLADVSPGELDLERFTQLHDRARAEARKGNWEIASGLLAEGLTIWRGEPLADVPSAVLHSTEAARLVEMRIQAVELRITAELECGRHGGVTAELMQLAAAHPLRERFWAQLMLALYRSGRQGEALSAYQRARAVLRSELGVDPGSELAGLHSQILAGDPVLDLGEALKPRTETELAQPAPASTVALRPMQVPSGVTDFTGRAETIAVIRATLKADALSASTGGIVAISGPGGIGKSTLAIHLAHQLAAEFPGGQLYAALGGESGPVRPADVLATFLRSLGVIDSAIPSPETERSAMFRTMLADRRMLIVLDDARDAAQVRPLLPGSGSSAVMVTSRRTLADLAGARLIDLDSLSESDSRSFLTAIIGSRAAAHEDTDSVVASCAGLPLALRIAASRMAARPSWTVGHLSRLLADERRRLAELRAGDQAVRASFAVSYHALAPEAARVFRLLGLARLPVILTSSVAALADLPVTEVAPVLEGLIDVHLLQSPAPGRYQLHDLLRIYAAELAEQIDSEPEREAAVGRIFDSFTATAIEAARALHPSRRFPGSFTRGIVCDAVSTPAEALAWFESQRCNLVSVTERAARSGQDDVAALIPAAMWAYFQRKAFYQDWVATHQAGVTSARRSGDDATLSWLLNSLGQVYGLMGEFDAAQDYLGQALEIRKRLGNRAGQAAVLNSLGLLHSDKGLLDHGLEYLRQAYMIHAALGDPADIGVALNNIGDTLVRLKRYDEALPTLRNALEFRRKAADRYGEAVTESTIGEAYWAMGEHEDSVRHLRLALAAFNDDGGEERHLGVLLYQLGSSLDSLGRRRDAQQTWRTALPMLDRLGDPRAAELRRQLGSENGALQMQP
jgi:DNA-binding SARP family transcriptional activator